MGRKNIRNLEYPLRPVLHCDEISVPELTHSPDLEINESIMDCQRVKLRVAIVGK